MVTIGRVRWESCEISHELGMVIALITSENVYKRSKLYGLQNNIQIRKDIDANTKITTIRANNISDKSKLR